MASVAEARTAIALGADALGLVGPMPTGPGVIDDAGAAEITAATPPPVASFLLTAETTAEGIAAHAERVGPTALQLVRHLDPAEHARLDAVLPRRRVKRAQAIHVEGPEALDLIAPYAPHVDLFLLDSGRPSALELGGTGRVHDWSVSAEFVRRSPVPVFLAGGLTPENAGEAIRSVRPYGLDLCTGVRMAGRLDAGKLAAFMRAVSAADAAPR